LKPGLDIKEGHMHLVIPEAIYQRLVRMLVEAVLVGEKGPKAMTLDRITAKTGKEPWGHGGTRTHTCSSYRAKAGSFA
jgi:hypothetical protein